MVLPSPFEHDGWDTASREIKVAAFHTFCSLLIIDNPITLATEPQINK
jgi:hypothetical protein